MSGSAVLWEVLLVVFLTTFGSGICDPDKCTTTFDAVANIRGDLFFFKDQLFWRLDRHGRLMSHQPARLDTFWRGLPPRAVVSAVYERPDASVVFFCGRHFWVFWGRHALAGYPRPLSDLGLPEELASVEAAFVNRHNGASYLIADSLYWRFNELTMRVEADSPLPISRLCRGLPSRLDAAFTDVEGGTYFLQDQHYWRCDPARGVVTSYKPDLVAPRWLDCSLLECCLPDLVAAVETREWPGLTASHLTDAARTTAAPAALLVAPLAAVWIGL